MKKGMWMHPFGSIAAKAGYNDRVQFIPGMVEKKDLFSAIS